MKLWKFVVGLALAPLMALAGAGIGAWLSVRWAVTGRSRLPEAWRTTATGSPTPEEVTTEVAQMLRAMKQAKRN